MKLKGKNSEKLKEPIKQKMEKTLQKMEDTREKDSSNLRAQINAKLENLLEEKEKASKYISEYENKIKSLKDMSLKIDGALIALKEIISHDTNV